MKTKKPKIIVVSKDGKVDKRQFEKDMHALSSISTGSEEGARNER